MWSRWVPFAADVTLELLALVSVQRDNHIQNTASGKDFCPAIAPIRLVGLMMVFGAIRLQGCILTPSPGLEGLTGQLAKPPSWPAGRAEA